MYFLSHALCFIWIGSSTIFSGKDVSLVFQHISKIIFSFLVTNFINTSHLVTCARLVWRSCITCGTSCWRKPRKRACVCCRPRNWSSICVSVKMPWTGLVTRLDSYLCVCFKHRKTWAWVYELDFSLFHRMRMKADVVTITVTIVYQFSLAVVIARKLDMTCKVDMKQYMYKGWI